MEITEAQYERIAPALPVQRGNVKLSNLQVLNAILEVEQLFRRLKGFRRIFPRFEKIDVLFLRFISFALILNALR